MSVALARAFPFEGMLILIWIAEKKAGLCYVSGGFGRRCRGLVSDLQWNNSTDFLRCMCSFLSLSMIVCFEVLIRSIFSCFDGVLCGTSVFFIA